MERDGVSMGKPINVEVYIRKGDSVDRAIKRFIKKCKKEGVIENILSRRYYEKPSVTRHKKKLRIKRLNEQNSKKIKEESRRA